jgi:hypothetical protein
MVEGHIVLTGLCRHTCLSVPDAPLRLIRLEVYPQLLREKNPQLLDSHAKWVVFQMHSVILIPLPDKPTSILGRAEDFPNI